MIIVDPPSGWKYGFPREFDFKPTHQNPPGEASEEYKREFFQWFRDRGYPDDLIRQGMLDHCRFWEVK